MAATEHARVTFREMTLADLDRVLEVESRAYAYPWSRGIFSDCLRGGHDCRVMSADGELVGHAVLSSAAGEAHLLNVCVSRDRQGQGFGRQFVHHLIDRARLLGAQVLFLEVRPSNHVALALYESMGFVQIGTRRDYYPAETGREDAYVLAFRFEEVVESG